ncbi:MAG: hypothetical protein LBS57_07335, partial [Treponema sp.]|nr:hypothetical protein [Treponema sp.]
MDLNSLLNRLVTHAIDIDIGRRGFMIDGGEREGRIHYQRGIAGSLTCFQEAQSPADCRTIVLAETAFLEQELQFCAEADSVTRSSLTQAIQSFEDALLSLEA